jgi:chromosome segregation ATPase
MCAGRVEAVEAVMSHQDALLATLRKTERTNRADVLTVKKSVTTDSQEQHETSQRLLEAEQNWALIQKSVDSEKSRNAELKSRCDDLASQLEKERKLR